MTHSCPPRRSSYLQVVYAARFGVRAGDVPRPRDRALSDSRCDREDRDRARRPDLRVRLVRPGRVAGGAPDAARRSWRRGRRARRGDRSEEHTSELQSLMRISYAVFCLKKKKIDKEDNKNTKR